jgi:hypothetical protein
MKVISMIGSFVVTLALASYTTGFISERKTKRVTSRVLLFYTLGITLDITATILMILGSSKGMVTLHGFIGYSSLLGMLIDTAMLWRFNRLFGPDKTISPRLDLISRITYTWWVLAYITGGLLVAYARMKG